MVELLDIYDDAGHRIGLATRRECHGNPALLHRTAHVVVINCAGDRLLLQKRSAAKDIQPGKWDTAVGGHVDYGEGIIEALYREASEELGFSEFNPVHIVTYVFESDVEKELVNVFAAVGSFSLFPDKDEVEEGRYWELKEIEENFGKSVFTPNFEQEFARIRNAITALL